MPSVKTHCLLQLSLLLSMSRHVHRGSLVSFFAQRDLLKLMQ